MTEEFLKEKAQLAANLEQSMNEIAILNAKSADLDDQLKKAQTKIEELKGCSGMERFVSQESENELEKNRVDESSLKQALSKIGDLTKELQKQTDYNSQFKNDFENLIKEKERSINDLQSQISELTTRLSKTENETNNFMKIEKEMDSLKDQLKKTEDTSNELTCELVDIKAKNDDLKLELKKLEAERADLTIKPEKNENTNATSVDIGSDQATVENKKQEELARLLDQIKVELVDKATQLEDIKLENKKLVVNLEQSEIDNNNQAKKLEESNVEKSRLVKEIAELNKDHANLMLKQEKPKKVVEQVDQAVQVENDNQGEEEKSFTNQEYSSEQQRVQIEKLQKKVAELENKLNERVENEDLGKKVSDLDQARVEMNELNIGLRRTEDDNEKLAAQLDTNNEEKTTRFITVQEHNIEKDQWVNQMAELNKNHSNQLADLKKGFERADIENEKLNSILTHKFKQSDARVIELTSELERNKAENSEKKFYSQKEDAMIKLNIAESIKVDLEAKIKRIQAENSKQVDELIDLQTENAFLNKQITLLKDIEIKYNLVDLELKKFQNEINNLSQKLEKSSLLNDELEKTSGEVKNENDDLKQRLKRAEDENFNFAKEINAWKYKHQALTDENNLLQSGHNLMQEELNNPKEEKRLANEAAQAKLSGRRANGKPPIAPPTYEIHASNQSLSKAGEDLKAAKDAYLNANEQSSIVEGKLRRMTIDFEQVQKENTDLIETRKQIEDKHKNALKIKQEENEMRCAELDTAYLEKFKQSQEKVYELERKLNDLKTKNADLRKTMRLNNLVDVESETESIESLKVSELDEARIKINELEAHLKKVQEMSDQLGEELNDSYEDNKKLTDTLDALTIEKDTLVSDLEGLKDHAKELENKLVQCQLEMTKIKSLKSKSETDLQKEKENNKLNKDHTEITNALKQELAGLNIELEKARGQMTKLSAELENKNAENVTLSKKIESYKLVTELADPKAEKTINPESGNLVEVKSQLESLKIDLQKAKNDKKELKANLAKAKNRITELEWDLMDKNEPKTNSLVKLESKSIFSANENNQERLDQTVENATGTMKKTNCIYWTSNDGNDVQCPINFNSSGQVTLRDFKEKVFQNSPWMTLGSNLKHVFMFAKRDKEFGELKVEVWNDDEFVPLNIDNIIYCWIESYYL